MNDKWRKSVQIKMVDFIGKDRIFVFINNHGIISVFIAIRT